MIKNAVLVVSLLLNYLLYTGQLDLWQYRNYVEKTTSALDKTTISVDSPAGSFSWTTKWIIPKVVK